MKKLLLLLIFPVFSYSYSDGQGTVRGKVTDENGAPLIGATIMLKSIPPIGTVSDFDGNYSIKVSGSSSHIIIASYVGYQSIQDTVNPVNGGVIIRNFDMEPLSASIGEVTVVGRVSKARESYMEKVKLNSASTLDFISATIIKRTGDANVTAAVSRITGVSTHGGFITVRGISDRYVKTTINGLRIPTLDPFTNNIKLDLFPASLVDNIVITKTSSADLPGDWSGAYLSIETKDYPEKFTLNIESSFGYNAKSTFKNMVSSERSNTDWLGFDNGLRTITHEKPANYGLGYLDYQEFASLGLKDFFNNMGVTENTYWDPNAYTSIYTRLALVELGFLGKAQFNDIDAVTNAVAQYEASELKLQGLEAATANAVKMGQSLPNNWFTINRKSPIDFSQSLSIGSQTNLFQKPFGYLFGFRYSSSTLYDKNGFYGRTEVPIGEVTTLDEPYFLYHTYGEGENSTETNGWSALLNLAYKINPFNSVSLIIMPNLIGVNKARNELTYSDKTGSGVSFYRISQFYESRRQIVYEIKTEHFFPVTKMKIELNASYTDGNSNSPDYKQLNYTLDPVTGGAYKIHSTSQESGNFRIFRRLSEDLFDSRLIAELPLGERAGLSRKIKFGGAWQGLIRKADQHFYALPPNATSLTIENNDLAAYLSIDNFGFTDDGSIKRYYWQLAGPEHNTIGFSNTLAGFLMTDFALTPALRISAGIRVEDVHLHTDITDLYDRQLSVNDDRRLGIKPGLRDDFFWLPSASIIYQLKKDELAPVNLRFNYSQTIALPSLRELTPYRIYDYTLLGVVTGNASLKPVNIDNWDIRAEAYFKKGDNVSLSMFYKKFINHIEMLREELEDVYYSWQNTDNSQVIGIEMEGSVGITKNLELRANTTLVNSKTRLQNDTISRAMFGQAPYIINAMLSYNSEKLGLEASINYNVQGSKLVITGTFDRPDIYELPRNLIDAKFTKKLGKYFTVSFRIRDLLNTSIVRSYKYSSVGFLDFDRTTYGTTYLLGLSYNFN